MTRSNNLTLFSAFLLALIALCSLCCSPAISLAEPPSGDDVLVYSWSSNVGPLNPHLYSPNQMFAQALVYEPLLKYQIDGSVAPWLAESWSVSGQGREYTFTLRQDVTFSDGTPFDAHAVKKNFDAVIANHERHHWLELINQLQGAKEEGKEPVTVIDGHTIRFTLKDPYYPALQELALIRPVRFLSPAAFPADGNTANGMQAPIGTGPWKVVEMVKGEYDVFERNESYWGEKPKMRHLVIKVIPDTNARSVAFDTGEIDLIYGSGGHGSGQIGLDTFQRYQQMKEMVTAISQPMATRAIAINSNRFPTNDLAVRSAILHAVNKPALIQHIFLGVEQQADTLFAPTMPYCDLSLSPFSFDPARAGELLDKAGWLMPQGSQFRMKNDKELMVELCFIGNDALQKSVAEVIQADLRHIGIKVSLVGEENDSFLTRQKNGEFGMIFGDTFGASYDPHSFCSSMRVPSHADYQAQLGLPMKAAIDAKIGEVLVSQDEERRQRLYADILGTLHQQAVYLPLTYMTSIMVHRPELAGAAFGPTKSEIPFQFMEKR